VYCGTGCQTEFGFCGQQNSPSNPPTGPLRPSLDGACGGSSGFTCLNSPYGSCCSEHNWCGSASDYCGDGCQSAFGLCGVTDSSHPAPTPVRTVPSSSLARPKTASSTLASSSPAPVGKLVASTNGKCGKGTDMTCSGSKYGTCCIQFFANQPGQCYAEEKLCNSFKANCAAEYGTC
jgi:Chitin recognition protein